jgi:probable F420-dependent oxidoreductase
MTPTWGLNLPLPALALGEDRGVIDALPDLGFDSVWTGEGGGQDAFIPLAAAAAWQPRLGLGTGVVPVATRGHGVLAQTAVTLAELAGGQVLLGVGSSVAAHVTALNGVPFEKPLTRTRDTVRFLKQAFTGQPITTRYETLDARGFVLRQLPARPPKVILGALRQKMLRFAYDAGDGAIVNLVFADDLAEVLARADAPRPGKETIVKLFVCPTTDREHARASGRAFLGWLLNQKPYHAFHGELPNGPRLAASQERFAAGDMFGACAALPDDIVDQLWINGSAEACSERIARYLLPGVTKVVLYVAPTPELLRNPSALPQLLATLRPEAAVHV